jgi:hypothetical protein
VSRWENDYFRQSGQGNGATACARAGLNGGLALAKIIALDTARKKAKAAEQKMRGCRHRQVTAYALYRSVRCAICGAELDPFDVLVDMLKAQIPNDAGLEEKRLHREIEKRGSGKNEKDKPAQD